MQIKQNHFGGYRFVVIFCVFVAILAGIGLAGCGTLPVGPTPTPTRTPKPTITPTPTATATPSPTPTPAFPVTVGCVAGMPPEACAALQEVSVQDPAHFAWIDDGAAADVQLGFAAGAPGARLLGEWTYAAAVPFLTVEDEISSTDAVALWLGGATSPQGEFLALRPMFVSTETHASLVQAWGVPTDSVRVVAASALLSETTAANGWAMVPFQALVPQWKVLRVDGISLLEKGLQSGAYPFVTPVYLQSIKRPEVLDLFALNAAAFTNRDEGRMTIVVMTGVTAMTRATAQLMDSKGITYPAQDIKSWFSDADFVHISNEVSFRPDCVAEGSGTMSFCSHDSYIGLLEEIKTNIVELTGNHLEDKGNEWVDYSLDMYRARGWQWFGGGANQAEGSRPLTITHGVNRIAFIGCNTVGPFADDTSGGAARCDFEQEWADIRQLRDAGYQPIVTVQYLEDYNYAPTDPQMRDFRNLADAGAVMVQGSQAHQAQTFEFYGETFIHYGLGNFFFDQMWSDGTRQEFVDRLTFYDGRRLGVDLRTAIMEESGRPRPMTVGDANPAADRAKFLQMMFDLRP